MAKGGERAVDGVEAGAPSLDATLSEDLRQGESRRADRERNAAQSADQQENKRSEDLRRGERRRADRRKAERRRADRRADSEPTTGEQSVDELSAELQAADERARDEQRELYRTLDLALRIGEVVLASGAGTADATATILSVTASAGLRGCEVDITFTSIAISYQAAPDVAPETHMRVVRYRGQDFSRLTAVDQLVRRFARAELTREEASRELARIVSAGPPFPRWSSVIAWGVMAGGATLLLGGGWLITLVAVVTACFIELSNRWFNRQRLPAFYQQVAGAFVATAVALILYAVHAPVKPSLVVAAGIIMLLAGIALTGAVQDAITGYYVTAAARSLEAMLLTGGIIAGVSLGISLGIKLGLPVAIEAQTIQLSNLPVMIGSGALMAVAFAYASYSPLRSLLPIGVVGALGSLVFTLMSRAEFGPAWSTAAAAFVIGLAGYSLGRRSGVPPLVVVVSGTVPLLPGLTIYKGLLELMSLGNLIGIVSLATAVAIGVALASGVILGEYVAQPIRREARRLEDRLAGPRLVGPRRPTRRRTERSRSHRSRRTRGGK
ncbi:threonine/serine ThrE exporter family protein [Kribbella sp. CA-293567]|uniref:threonine/serine ThrE exporter family protein n=1 Tax=Kribbella sp. CA-293567 TaxID=3002436 RepID=UPI0022DE6F87|nr:threonine/serine exporter family protein [Kribbella sp. CA-293567]WBQ05144.1 threonine/serine exporter family protein [Kribbella sp. CA-293567]